MAKKKKGFPIHGWLIIDKAVDIGSTDIVGKVKWLTKAQKAGHGGTLDPFATGLLPIALGEATKTMSYVMDGEKTYQFTVRWGIQTDSLDSDGDVTGEDDLRPDQASIEAALPAFIGTISQTPPAHSAIKINGKRAYDLVRSGEAPEMKPRDIQIHSLKLLEMVDADHARFEVSCGKGTYVRAIGRDLAEKLGVKGHLVQLRRIKVGSFTEADAMTIPDLETVMEEGRLDDVLMPVGASLKGIASVQIDPNEATRLRNGQTVSVIRKIDLERISGLEQGQIVAVTLKDAVIALARYEKGLIHPVRVLVT